MTARTLAPAGTSVRTVCCNGPGLVNSLVDQRYTPNATAAIARTNTTTMMPVAGLRIGSTLQQGRKARLHFARDGPDAEIAFAEGANRPDADARVGNEDLVGAREMLLAQHTLLDGEAF